MSNPLRIVFMGTAHLSCPILEALLVEPGFEVVAVVTQPDRAKGRDLKLQPSAVKELALRKGLPVLQPPRARDPQFVLTLKDLQPDLIAVAAYGQILPPEILDLPPHGCLNVHTSLLPKYRGAAPIQWAIINGDPQTGVTIMKMDRGLDTGDILTRESTPILPEDDSITLHERLARMGADLLARTIPLYTNGSIQPEPQPAEGATLAPKIRKEDGLADWTQSAEKLRNRLRGLVPWPGLFTFVSTHGRPALLKIWEAQSQSEEGAPGTVIQSGKNGILVACGKGALNLTCVQAEGGRRMSARDFLAGHPLPPGTRLGKQ